MNPKKLTQSDLFYRHSVSQIVQRKMNSIISGAHDLIRFRRLTIARVGNKPNIDSNIRFVQRAPHSEKKFRMWNMNPRKLNQIRSTSDFTRSWQSHIIVCHFESREGCWVSCGILRPYSRQEKVLSCAHWLSTRSSRFAWILCSQNIRVSSPTFNISPNNSEPQ